MVAIYFLCAVIGYFLGNVQFSILISKWLRKDDVRKYGSGNAGATNMLRTYGWSLGILTFVLDIAKGALAYLIGGWIGGPVGAAAAGIAVVLGHNFPALYGFKGGKGIACTIGIMLAVDPVATLIIGAGAILVVALSRYVSVGSLLVITLFFLYALAKLPAPVKVLAAVLLVLGYARHWGNLQRLVKGTEPPIGKSTKDIS